MDTTRLYQGLLLLDEQMLLVRNRPRLLKILELNRFDLIFLSHLRDDNLNIIVMHSDLLRLLMIQVEKGCHMPTIVSLSHVSQAHKARFRNNLRSEYIFSIDGDEDQCADEIERKKKKYNIPVA